MTDESSQERFDPRRYSRMPRQPRIRFEGEEEVREKIKGTPFENMTFDEMLMLGLVIGGAVFGSAVGGAIIGSIGGSLVGFRTGAWWGRRSTKSK